ncbi:MAG: hypothetical protein ABIP93_10820 [Gemmatimonadaceae bacterium]
MTREQANVSYTRRAGEDRLEEAPAVIWRTSEIDCKLPKHAALPSIARICHQRTTELAPAGRQSNVDETSDAALAESEDGLWRTKLEVAEQRNGGHTRKLSHEAGDTVGLRARTADGHEHRLDLPRFEVPDQIVHTLAM